MACCQYGTYEDLTNVCKGEAGGVENEEEEESFVLNTLLEAADEGNIQEIQDLMRDLPDVNLNVHNKHFETALHFASAAGHEDVVRLLVERGADVHCRDKHQDSPLYWAARQGHLKVMECLKVTGADINATNKVGQTALHAAVRYYQTEVIEYLCSLAADVDAQDVNGETVLHMLAWLGSPKTLCDVLASSSSNLDAKNKNEETALHVSAGRGSLDCLRSLVDHGAAINATDKRGSTPLHLACHCHHILVIKELLTRGCCVDAVDQNGDAPLHVLCQSSNLALVQMLCAYGCNVDVVNKMGRSPLHISAKLGHTEIVRCLLLAGATIDLPSKNNITAEMMALARGKNDTSELLSKLTYDRQVTAIKQLLPSSNRLGKIKLKVFGDSGVGKTRFIDSLRRGFFGSLLKRAGIRGTSQVPSVAASPTQPGQTFVQLVAEKNKKRGNSNVRAPMHEHYTQGIDVQTFWVTGGATELSVWEFSGYEAYHQFYDAFIGDVNCIHVVCFNPLRSTASQMKEINYWLNFIKSCIPPSEFVGAGGALRKRAKVILVGVLIDPGKSFALFEEDCDGWRSLQEFPKVMNVAYSSDLHVADVAFAVDPDHAASPQMKSLRSCIADLKTDICKELPNSSGFLDATVSVLPGWRRVLSSYPVVTWSNFVEYLRSTVNLLASEEHLKELVYKLQLMGEVTFVETTLPEEEDLVVLDVKWLCGGVLGRMLSYETTSRCRPTGCFGSDDFQLLFSDCEAVELLQLLQALTFCTRCDVDDEVAGGRSFARGYPSDVQSNNSSGTSSQYNQDCFAAEYELPCLNFVETLVGLWDRNDARLAVNTVYGGCRFVAFCHRCQEDASTKGRRKSNSSFTLTSLSQNKPRKFSSASESLENASSQSNQSSPDHSSPPSSPLSSVVTRDGRRRHNHLAHLFPRLQVMLRRHYMPDKSNSEIDLYQWHWGSKYCRGLLEVLITCESEGLDDPFIESASNDPRVATTPRGCECCGSFIELKCRGPSDMAGELFEFAESIKEVIKNTIQLSCPSLDYKQEILSSLHLSDHRKKVKSYSQREVVQASLNAREDPVVSFVECDGKERFESLLDLLALGNEDVYDRLELCPDLPASGLSVSVRRKLAALLDPSDTTGCDWCMLAILLGLSEQMPSIDSAGDESASLSSTDRVLEAWCGGDRQKSETSVGVLVSKLGDLNRHDAVEVLVSLGPLYRYHKMSTKSDDHVRVEDYNHNFGGDQYFGQDDSYEQFCDANVADKSFTNTEISFAS